MYGEKGKYLDVTEPTERERAALTYSTPEALLELIKAGESLELIEAKALPGTNLTYIYLRYFVCVCVCVCVCVTICCGTLCYSFSFNNQADQGDETEVWRGRDMDGEIGKGQIGDGECEETFLCLSLNCESCRLTAPPAVALLIYISCGILWRIFCPTGIFAVFFFIICRKDQRSCDGWGKGWGTMTYSNMMSCTALSRMFSKTEISTGFSLYNIFTGRNSKAAMAGGGGLPGIVFRLQHSSIRVQRSSVGCSVAQKGTA